MKIEKITKEILSEFKDCGWIWYDICSYDDVNVYMFARKEFKIDEIPKKTEIRITADSRYKLYVNCKYVCYGPARGFPEKYPFDIVDITSYLRKGKNVLGAVVHQYGHGTFQSIYAGASGFLVSGKVGRVDIGTVKNSWLVKKCAGHKQNMVRRTLQLGYQENFDARNVEIDWLFPEADIKEGKNGWIYGNFRSVGCAPWFNLEERGIPLLKEEIKNFRKVLFAYYGNCSMLWENARNLTKIYIDEKNGENGNTKIKHQENMLKDNSEFTVITQFPAEKRITLIIDFGEEVTGFLGIDAVGSGGEVVDFTTSEVLENGWLCMRDPEKDCKIVVSDRFIFHDGRQNFETFSIHGFRYLSLTFRNVSKPLKVYRLYVRQVSYPFKKTVVFKTSDPLINEIWDMCIRTQICCSLDAYIDCPWREQAQWWGDARVQAANTFYAFGDMKLLRRGIKQAGQSQLSNGLIFGHFPTIAVGSILPDFTLTWIDTHLDYYFYTGDGSLLKEQFQQIKNSINFFQDYIDKNYLLGSMPEWWVFLDWAPLYKDGWSCLFNLLYLSSLRTMVKICDILEKSDERNFYQKQSETVEKKIIKTFWDEKRKVLWDGYDPKKKKHVKKISQHVHAIAILLDLKKPYHKYWSEEILIPPMKRKPLTHPDIIEASPFYYYYVINALKKVGGYEVEIIDFIKRRWGQMVKEGATTCYEMWNPTPGAISLCHAWSAHPIVHFMEIFAGLKFVSQGWKKFKVNPGKYNLDFVKASIPTKKSAI